MEAMRQECGRLTADNNELHVQLIAESERAEAAQREAYVRAKALEAQVVELRLWKQQASTCMEAQERGNAALRKQVRGRAHCLISTRPELLQRWPAHPAWCAISGRAHPLLRGSSVA